MKERYAALKGVDKAPLPVLDRFADYERRTRFVPGHAAVCGLEVVA